MAPRGSRSSTVTSSNVICAWDQRSPQPLQPKRAYGTGLSQRLSSCTPHGREHLVTLRRPDGVPKDVVVSLLRPHEAVAEEVAGAKALFAHPAVGPAHVTHKHVAPRRVRGRS